MRELRQDARYALRSIRNNPGFTTAVVLTLALGIGANTAIFSVVHAVLLEPIAYPAKTPEDVVVLAESAPRGGRMGVSYPTFVDWLEQVQSFEVMAGFRGSSYNLTSRNEPLRARVLMTSASYFDIHGVQPLLGRFSARRPSARRFPCRGRIGRPFSPSPTNPFRLEPISPYPR